MAPYSRRFYGAMLIASLSIALMVKFNREIFYDTNESINLLIGAAPSFFLFRLLMLIPIFSRTQTNSKFLEHTAFISLGALAYEIEQDCAERTFDMADIVDLLLASTLYCCLLYRRFTK
jgi:hypothetical protein